jgi:acetolactate synthase-1/2/3 large subunit
MGVCGHTLAADYLIDESDLLIVVGSSLGEFTTFNWDIRFLKNKKMIQIDIDNREIGKNYPVQLGLVGDAKIITHQLNQAIEKSNFKIRNSKAELEKYIVENKSFINSTIMDDCSVPLKPQRVMKEIRENTPDNTIFLADSGSHWAWAMHYLPIYNGGGFYPTIGLASMGASICSSIGVKLSKPENPVICICGDGSFLMYGNEVTTAQQYNIPVIWIILNDSKYNLPAVSLQKMFNRSIGIELNVINFSKLAEVFNIKGYRVEKPNELPQVLAEAITLKKPVVIDVIIDPNEMPPLGQRKL